MFSFLSILPLTFLLYKHSMHTRPHYADVGDCPLYPLALLVRHPLCKLVPSLTWEIGASLTSLIYESMPPL